MTSRSQSRARLISRQFDYNKVRSSLRARTEEEAHAIRALLADTARNIVQIGLRLQWVREHIGRDHFQEWLRAEFDWSRSTAAKFMRAADVFADVEFLDRFQPSALYILARHRVPESARQEALTRAQNGELITKALAEAIAERRDGRRDARRNPVDQVENYLSRLTQKLDREQIEELARRLREIATELAESSSADSARRNGHQPDRSVTHRRTSGASSLTDTG